MMNKREELPTNDVSPIDRQFGIKFGEEFGIKYGIKFGINDKGPSGELAPVSPVETKIPADLFVLFQIPIMLTKHISREMEFQLMQPKRITKQRTLTFVPSWPFNQV